MNPTVTQIILYTVHLYPAPGLLMGSIAIYSTPITAINPNPTSWVEMALQVQYILMNTYMDSKEVMFIIYNPKILAHLMSEEIKRVIYLYISHLWMSIVLQPQ